MPATRRLAAILAADVVGYSRLMGADEETALNYPEGSGAILRSLHYLIIPSTDYP